jgi:hypothetical protein
VGVCETEVDMNFAEFSSLLAVFLTGASATEASLTLTQDLEHGSLRAFIEEARRAGRASGMKLREVQVPGHLADRGSSLGSEVREIAEDGSIRFVYSSEA